MITQNNIIEYLTEQKSEFYNKYSIEKIGLFGSFATNKYTENSDIDIVYITDTKGLTFLQTTQLEDMLFKKFGKSIDLVNLKYMNPLIKRKAQKDILYV